MKTIDMTVDDVAVRIIHRTSEWDVFVNQMCDVYIDGLRCLVLYKPSQEKLVEKIRLAIKMCDLPRPLCPRCGEVMLVHSLGADCVFCS
jgi:hypothetical protein